MGMGMEGVVIERRPSSREGTYRVWNMIALMLVEIKAEKSCRMVSYTLSRTMYVVVIQRSITLPDPNDSSCTSHSQFFCAQKPALTLLHITSASLRTTAPLPMLRTLILVLSQSASKDTKQANHNKQPNNRHNEDEQAPHPRRNVFLE